MSAKNNCNFIGNIGRDCDVRQTKSGTSVATFPMDVEIVQKRYERKRRNNESMESWPGEWK